MNKAMMKKVMALALAITATAAMTCLGQATPPSDGSTLTSPQESLNTPGSYTKTEEGYILRGLTKAAANVAVPSVIQGQLVSIDVKEGDAVKKGQVLAKLDDQLQAEVVEAAKLDAGNDAEVRLAKAQISFAQNDYEAVKNNQAAGDAEKRQKQLALEQAQISLDYQKEKLAAAGIKLEQEQTTLDRLTIRSPLDGVVFRINKQVGDQTDQNPLMIVVQTRKLDALFYPPRELFGKVAANQKVKIQLQTMPPVEREATVIAVDPIVDAAGLFRIELELDNADGTIPAGTPAIWTVKAK